MGIHGKVGEVDTVAMSEAGRERLGGSGLAVASDGGGGLGGRVPVCEQSIRGPFAEVRGYGTVWSVSDRNPQWLLRVSIQVKIFSAQISSSIKSGV